MYRRDRMVSADERIDYLEALERLRAPVLAITSEGDRLLAPPAVVARFLAAPRAPGSPIAPCSTASSAGRRRATWRS